MRCRRRAWTIIEAAKDILYDTELDTCSVEHQLSDMDKWRFED
jgi:hypothetical protein